MSAADLERFAAFDIRLICDLRTPGERAEWPDRLPAGREPEVLTVRGGDDVTTDIRRVLKHSLEDTAEQARNYMFASYRSFPSAFAEILGALCRHLMEPRGGALVHCAAGKDRTGFVCAVVLLAIGVPRAAVFEDYLLSDHYFGAQRIAEIVSQRYAATVPAPVLDALRVHREYLETSLELLEREHGSIGAYLESRAGVDQAALAGLRESLLEAA